MICINSKYDALARGGKPLIARKATHRLSTVDNAISLLTMFLKYDSIGLTDIEKELGVSKTGAFRLASTLADRGFLIKDAKTKNYYLGQIVFQLVHKFQINDIMTFAMPFIQELADHTKESVYLSIRTGHQYVCLAGVESNYPVKVTIPFGQEIDLYFGAAGKLHLAYMSDAALDNYFKRTFLVAYTTATLTDAQALRKELSCIREAGYSISLGEREPEAGAVAAPIWGSGEEPIAVLGVFLPLTRFTKNAQVEIKKLVIDYALTISTQFQKKQQRDLAETFQPRLIDRI